MWSVQVNMKLFPGFVDGHDGTYIGGFGFAFLDHRVNVTLLSDGDMIGASASLSNSCPAARKLVPRKSQPRKVLLHKASITQYLLPCPCSTNHVNTIWRIVACLSAIVDSISANLPAVEAWQELPSDTVAPKHSVLVSGETSFITVGKDNGNTLTISTEPFRPYHGRSVDIVSGRQHTSHASDQPLEESFENVESYPQCRTLGSGQSIEMFWRLELVASTG